MVDTGHEKVWQNLLLARKQHQVLKIRHGGLQQRPLLRTPAQLLTLRSPIFYTSVIYDVKQPSFNKEVSQDHLRHGACVNQFNTLE